MKLFKFVIILSFLSHAAFSDDIHRYGTTTTNFLEIGIGSASGGMGEAYVAVANDLSAIYWNPAGLSSLKGVGVQFMLQPWVVDINTIFAAGAVNVPRIGTFALSLTQIGYGQMDVTTLTYQEGTGEQYTANELALTFSFSRRLVPWFSFGTNAKLVQSNIWHASANAFALDLGVLVNTHFFSVTGEKEDGMMIGMSISNYGTRMKYDGIDLYQPIDISEYEEGNYGDVAGQFRTQEWELPLLFRIGVAVKPIVSNFATLTLAADALHPNNNTESINIGFAFKFKFPGNGAVIFRGGQKALFMDKPQFGLTWGLGLEWNFLNNRKIVVDYAYKTMGILGNVHATTIGLNF
ncbi:MAG TPA: PorV/PorQ family protein [Candidatus Marinimicrobia bacterium]|nr:PorV/PorQ family protein [Candidatus Neomarinimicrobiota bacterium]